MVELTFNGQLQSIASVAGLGEAFDRFDAQPQFELWASAPEGPSMCMLRSGMHAWLMYLRQPGDSGYNSVGDRAHAGTQKYLLSNGQIDEYPLSWCIEVDQCYKALAYFFVNGGGRPEWVNWHET